MIRSDGSDDSDDSNHRGISLETGSWNRLASRLGSACMGDAGLSIEIYFAEEQPPVVWQMLFKVRPPGAEGKVQVFKRLRKKNKFDVREDRFEWRSKGSQGTKGFILALLSYKLGLKKHKNGT